MLPTKWIDEIFRRLSVRYGREFSLKYENLDPNAVKRDWAEYLGGFAGLEDLHETKLEEKAKAAQRLKQLKEMLGVATTI